MKVFNPVIRKSHFAVTYPQEQCKEYSGYTASTRQLFPCASRQDHRRFCKFQRSISRHWRNYITIRKVVAQKRKMRMKGLRKMEWWYNEGGSHDLSNTTWSKEDFLVFHTVNRGKTMCCIITNIYMVALSFTLNQAEPTHSISSRNGTGRLFASGIGIVYFANVD